MKAVLFCRVSSKEQEETGYSLPAQEKLLRSYCDNKGFIPDKVFAISESASGKKQRETFEVMISYVLDSHIGIIICEKVDRLTRNFKDAVMIDDWLEKNEERQVHLVKDSLVLHKNSRSQEKLNWGIRILFAKNYIDNLSEEVKKGYKEKIAQGWLPRTAPLGYKTVGEHGHKIHIVDESYAHYIKQMFSLYSTGQYSLKALTVKMYESGLRSRNGVKVPTSCIHNFLRDPFYVGEISWQKQIYPGKHEPLVDRETFNQVQKVLTGKNTPYYAKRYFAYRGLIHCTSCTGTITWETHKGINYGHCNHYRNCPQTVWVTQTEVENQLVPAFENLQLDNPRLIEWIRKALKESHQDKIAFKESSTQELTTKQEQLKKRLDMLYDDKLDGKITETFYNQKYSQYSKELKDTESMLGKHNDSNDKYHKLGLELYDLSQHATDTFLHGTGNQKHDLITQVFERISLDNGKVIFKYTETYELFAKAIAPLKSSKLTKTLEQTDKIFEPNKNRLTSIQNDILYAFHPSVLPR